MEMGTRVQILKDSVFLSLHVNTFGKGMNLLVIFSSPYWLGCSKKLGEKSEFKPTLLNLKIDLMSHPVHCRGF